MRKLFSSISVDAEEGGQIVHDIYVTKPKLKLNLADGLKVSGAIGCVACGVGYIIKKITDNVFVNTITATDEAEYQTMVTAGVIKDKEGDT